MEKWNQQSKDPDLGNGHGKRPSTTTITSAPT